MSSHIKNIKNIKNVKSKKQDVDNKNVIESLAKISEAVVSDLYLDDVLKLIVTMTAEILGSKICSLMLIDAQTKELVINQLSL